MKKCIVLVGKNFDKTILNYYNNISIQSKIYIVSPTVFQEKKIYDRLIFLEDSFFLQKNKFINKTTRPNWYFQQFLKYMIVLKLKEDIIHLIDGDSILKFDLFFTNKITYTRKKIDIKYKKFNKLYNNTFLNTNKNFIVNHMVFEKKTLRKMLSSMLLNENNFIEKICNHLVSHDIFFSEYQTYALFAMINNNKYKISKIKVFRRFDLVYNKNIKNALKKYSLISYENYHNKSYLKILYANFLYYMGLNYG
jgi:hypothetical protein